MPYRKVIIDAWVPGPGEPVDPGWGQGRPPVDPGYGHPAWGPVDPGYGQGRPPVDPGYGRPSWGPVDPGYGQGRPPVDPGYGRPSWGPVDPGYGQGRPPVDPGYGRPGWSPVDPGYGRPSWGPPDPGYGRPDWGGGHPSGGPIKPPTTLTPSSGTVLASGGEGDIQVSSGPGVWTVENTTDWVTLAPMCGMANGSVHFIATQNTTGQPKQATIKIGDSPFVLSQGAV